MNRKRSISVIFLAIIASAPLLLPSYFIISRALLRAEMLEKIEYQNLVSIQIPESEFQWYEEGREIIIKGKMFDVKSISLTNGVYFISGLFDEKETELKQKLQKQLEQQQNGNPASQQLVRFITAAAELTELPVSLFTADSSESIVSENYTAYFPHYFGAIVVPPPDC